MIHLQLFWSFFQIGLFSFGGGYAALPLIQQVVGIHSWLTMSELTDLVTISQMTPGPIAINAATFVGTQIGGDCRGGCGHAGMRPSLRRSSSLLAFLYYRYRSLTAIQGVLYGPAARGGGPHCLGRAVHSPHCPVGRGGLCPRHAGCRRGCSLPGRVLCPAEMAQDRPHPGQLGAACWARAAYLLIRG